MFPSLKRANKQHAAPGQTSGADGQVTRNLPIRRMPFPHEMVVKLSQHTGAPAQPLVRVGQEVVRGEPIARASGFVSIPMHAPATGEIMRIGSTPGAQSSNATEIALRVYPGASQEVLYGGTINLTTLAPRQLLHAIQAAGIPGYGPNALPLHVQLCPPIGQTIDTLIIVAHDHDPVFSIVHRTAIESASAIQTGIDVLLRATGARRAIVVADDRDPELMKALKTPFPLGPVFEHVPQHFAYPVTDVTLVKELLGRDVPADNIPAFVNASVVNVVSIAQIGKLIPKGEGLIEQAVTVTGNGLEKPGNYLIPLGTTLRFILEQVHAAPAGVDVHLDGQTTGLRADSLDAPLTKGISGIVVMQKKNGNARVSLYTRLFNSRKPANRGGN